MLWESLVEKRNQLATVESEFNTRKHADLNRMAEKLGTKKIVHSAEQERGRILRGQEIASHKLQRHIDATYKQSPSYAHNSACATYQQVTFNLTKAL